MQIILDHIDKPSQEIAHLKAVVLSSKAETRLDTVKKGDLTFLGHVHQSQTSVPSKSPPAHQGMRIYLSARLPPQYGCPVRLSFPLDLEGCR
jgi:hypothetical protein